MPDTAQLAPGQQAIYDSVYEALADYTSEADARAQAMEAATQPVPYRGSSEELAFHRGGPATFFGTRMNLAPGNIVDFPPAMLPPAPPEQPAELLSTNDVPGARFVQPPAASSVVPPTDAAFPRSAEPPPVPLPLGTERRFAPQPPAQFNPLEDIRKQINATQFKTAQEALAAATRFQYLRAFQRDVDSGVPAEKALLRWGPGLFEKNPTAISGMMREARAPFVPAPLPGATNIYRTGRYGERLWSPPNLGVNPPTGPVQSFPVLDEKGEPMPDFFATPSATGRGVVVQRKKPTEAKPTFGQNVSVLDKNIKAAENELKSLPTVLSGFPLDETIPDKAARETERKKRFDDAQAKRASLKTDIDAWRAQLKGMAPGAPAQHTAPPSVSEPSKPSSTATNQADVKILLEKANKAIADGKDRAAVLKWLESKGVKVQE